MKKKQDYFRQLILFLLMLPVSLGIQAQNQKITLPQKQMTLFAAFEEIEKQTDLTIAYNESVINVNRNIKVDITGKSLPEALSAILKDTQMTFKLQGKQIIIVPASETVQERKYSGTVTDEKSEPVIGASISIKGSQTGTVTDTAGRFSIQAAAGSTLLVSYVGFTPKEVKLGNSLDLQITISEDEQLLDEVVVVGYGTQKKVNLTGAVSVISSKELNDRPVVSAAGALQGADPAVNLTFNTGSPMSDYSVNVRGALSINSSSPLVLADGIEVSLSQINPNDIESISILKDASSSAIYGAKASAGVILITTKKGSDQGGYAKIRYNGRFGIAQNTTSTDFITTGYDHVVLANQFYNAYNGVDMFLYTEANGGLQKLYERRNDKTENPERPWTEVGSDGKYYYYGNFDWYDYFYQRARCQQEHNLSFSGGNDRINYYASGRIVDQDGIFKIYNDKYDDYSFRGKLNAKLKPWLRYSNNVGFDKSGYTYAGRYNIDHTIAALQSNITPAFLPLNPDGSIVQYTNQLYANSPIGAGHGGFLTANTSRNWKENRYLTLLNQIDMDIFKDFTVTASYGYRQRDRLYRYRNNTFEYSRQEGVSQPFSSGSVENSYQEVNYGYKGQNVNIYGTYKKGIGGHNITVVAGGQYEDYRSAELDAYQRDLLNEKLASFSIATGVVTLGDAISAYKTLGFFGRLNYDYQGKYLFEASTRGDGSSRFAPGSRWAVFPSASAGWRISEERFFEPLRNIWDNLKFRLSMGSLGNQQVSNYAYIDQITTDNTMTYTFDGKSKANYASVSAPVSSGLTWETVTTYDAGLDLGFFNHRLGIVADGYIRDTKNMLTTSLTLPSVYGASTPKANCADLRTTGYEFAVNWNDRFTLAGSPFGYNIQAGIGDYITKITKYYNPTKQISSYYEGMTLGEIWGYKVAGLFKTDKEAAEYQAQINDKAVNQRVYNCKGSAGNYLRAGDVHFLDLDNSNVIDQGKGTVDNPGDMRIIGNSVPRYHYSFRLGFNWKGIDCSTFFQGIGKANWFPAADQSSYDFWGPYAFPSTSFIHENFSENVWSEDNRNAYFPRPRGYQAYSGGALAEVNDRYLQDVSYLRFKNLTLGYTLPVAKKYIDKIRIYASGENLCYWSPLKKYSKTIDPELALTTGTYVNNSGTGYTYSRIFSFGAEITF
jgi:TonB-linked SusC/RagA family outer membrane protein